MFNIYVQVIVNKFCLKKVGNLLLVAYEKIHFRDSLNNNMNYTYVIKYTYLIEVSLFPLLKIYCYTKNEKITNTTYYKEDKKYAKEAIMIFRIFYVKINYIG